MVGILVSFCQWLFLVSVKGGRWHIIPQLAVYTTYILPSGGLYATYHLLREPFQQPLILGRQKAYFQVRRAVSFRE